MEHDVNLYSVYAHLQQGSVTVGVGDWVRTGQVLGVIGNSGNTDLPHLHFQLCDRPNIWVSQGLPLVFRRGTVVRFAELEGSTPLEQDWVIAPE